MQTTIYAGLIEAGDRLQMPGGTWHDVLSVRWPGRFDVIEIAFDQMGQRRTVRHYVDSAVLVCRAGDRRDVAAELEAYAELSALSRA